MERLVDIRESIVLYNIKYGKTTIDVEDWEIMKSCILILKPFEEITREFSNQNSCISSVIPMLQVLKKSLEEAKNTLKSDTLFKTLIDDLLSDIHKKFSNINNNNLYTISTFLDPRFKTKCFNRLETSLIHSEILKIIKIDNRERSLEILEKREKEIPTSSFKNNLIQMLDSDDEIFNESGDELDNVNDVLNVYENEKRLSWSENPLIWWMQNKIRYKVLFPLARRYLSAPPGSVASEQLFSGASLIYDPLRNKLEADKAAKLLFLKYNIRLLNFDY